jgi:ABC-type lipoprotein release transport system permease subunit
MKRCAWRLQAILRNAFRSFLTVLGIVIGVAAVIAMVTVGQGSTDQVEADVSTLGTNLLMIRPGQPSQGPGSGGGRFGCKPDAQGCRRDRAADRQALRSPPPAIRDR